MAKEKGQLLGTVLGIAVAAIVVNEVTKPRQRQMVAVIMPTRQPVESENTSPQVITALPQEATLVVPKPPVRKELQPGEIYPDLEPLDPKIVWYLSQPTTLPEPSKRRDIVTMITTDTGIRARGFEEKKE